MAYRVLHAPPVRSGTDAVCKTGPPPHEQTVLARHQRSLGMKTMTTGVYVAVMISNRIRSAAGQDEKWWSAQKPLRGARTQITQALI